MRRKTSALTYLITGLYAFLCCLFLTVCCFWTSTYAASDTTAPNLSYIHIPKQAFSPGDQVSVHVGLIEDGVGCNWISVSFRHTEYSAFYIVGQITFETVSDYLYSGDVEVIFTIPEDAAPGEYYLNGVDVSDARGNRDYIGWAGESDGNRILTIENDSYTGKTGIPRVSEINLIGSSAAQNEYVEIECISDADVSEYWHFLLGLRNISGSDAVYYSRAETWTSLGNNRYRGKLYFNTSIPVGQYNIFSCVTRSSEGKEREYYLNNAGILEEIDHTSTCTLTGPSVLTVTESTEPKPEPSEIMLTNVSVDKKSVARPGVISVSYTVESTAPLSGVGVGLSRDDIAHAVGSEDFYEKSIKKYSGIIDIPITRNCPLGVSQLYIYAWNIYGKSVRQFLTDIAIIDEFDVGFDVGVSNPNVLNLVRTLKEGETGCLYYSDLYKATASKTLFEAIQGRNVNLRFYNEAFEWIFNGKDISNPKDIVLNATLNFKYQDTTYTTLEGKIIPYQFLEVIFADNGELPGKTQIRLKSDAIWNIYNLKEKVYLYFENDETGVELVESASLEHIIDDTDHWCYFTITHNSTYVIGTADVVNTFLRKQTDTKPKLSRIYDKKTDAYYRLTDAGRKKHEIEYQGPKKKNSIKITIPSTITYQGVVYKVTTIAARAFANNKYVEKITIGRNVKTIGTKAFYGCGKLKSIVIKTTKLTVSSVGKKAFSGLNSSCKVKVPTKKRKVYRALLKKRGFKAKKGRII